jgi:AraC family transcriptional regulator of adaptative response/methylated-DNA-[protein]-cysteine methyltransferase
MISALPDRPTAWRAVQQRDHSYDGRFVYAVSSTRIFCRPSCPSRRPSAARVEFYASAADAQLAGYRPCKRCRPATAPGSDDPVARVCEHIANHADERLTLATLAGVAGMSPFHLQRRFRKAMGITPREFHQAQRNARLAARLRAGDTVSRATYEAGFGSSSRVYERSLGMTPATVRRGGAGQRIQFSIVDSPFGRLLAAYTERGVCSVALGEDDAALERAFRAQFPAADVHRAGATIHEWIASIVAGLEAGASPSVPLDARGSAFQLRVWKALQRIPRGTTLSYGEVARRIGRPTAARAVARACATNPVAVLVPCHRVVREDGRLGGYRWGVERKQAILDREREFKPS